MFFCVWLLCSYIFYRRFPNNYTQPNFFGEEGSVFANNIIHHGFWTALNTTFNGYYIWGIYILEKIAFIINSIFYGGEFVNLPRSFALVSYGFLGGVVALPVLLLRGYVKLTALIITVLLCLYVPMVGWDYGIIGTLGQFKFAFIYIAFLLLIYRNNLPAGSNKVYAVDIGLLISAYTNITVYPMLFFALIRYWPEVRGGDYFNKVKKLLLSDRTAQSLVILGILLLPQLLVIHQDGVPKIPGYLDGPYNYHRTIEIFISRSYLYGLLFPINKFLNDLIVVVLFATFLALAWKTVKKYRPMFIFGIATILLATLLFVIKRPGISAFYIGYKDAGPAQFFFPQNWIFDFIISVIFVSLVSRLKKFQLQFGVYLLAALFFVYIMTPRAGSYGRLDFESKKVGNIYANAQRQCDQDRSSQNLSITIYPTSDQHYNGLNRHQLCTPSVTNYQPEEVNLGLVPYGNNYIADLGNSRRFTQTFVSPQNNLNGIEVYFSTFMRRIGSPYDLKLMDKSCHQTIYTTHIHTKKIADNTFYTVPFPTINNSAGKTYCFSIAAAKPSAEPLAVQLSSPNSYDEGAATLNGKVLDTDVVFSLHYK